MVEGTHRCVTNPPGAAARGSTQRFSVSKRDFSAVQS
jgi:hypothetical protein